MTKGKKWTLRLLGVAALALLICLCLLGSTMARYTSQGTGNGSLTVALWDLETVEVSVSGQSVSPSDKPYYSDDQKTTAQARSNTSSYIEAFTLQNNSDVKAEVTVALDETKGVSFDWYVGSDYGGDDSSERIKNGGFTWGKGWEEDNGTNEYGAAIMNNMGETPEDFMAIVNGFGLFDIALAYETTNESEVTGIDKDGEPKYVVPMEGENSSFTIDARDSETLTPTEENFYAQVVWTSIMEPAVDAANLTTLLGLVPDAYYENDYTKTETSTDIGHIDWERFSDDVDTILGMYAESLTFNVVWTAVQASAVPAD